MTGTIAAPFDLRRFAGNVWIVVLAVIVAALAAGAFVLGRVTGGDSGSSIAPVHTVYLPAVAAHDATQQCRVHLPC